MVLGMEIVIEMEMVLEMEIVANSISVTFLVKSLHKVCTCKLARLWVQRLQSHDHVLVNTTNCLFYKA